jgi:hypothetical protein
VTAETRGDPREVGELLATWVGLHMQEVDALLAEGRDKVSAIPDQRVLWSLFGELLLQVRALELEVAELRRSQATPAVAPPRPGVDRSLARRRRPA